MSRRPDGEETPKRRPPTRAEFEARAQATRHDIEAGVQAAKAQFDATQEKIQARTGRNLVAAIGIGLALGGALLVSLVIPGLTWLFIIFAGLLVGFTVFELSSALRHAGRDVPRIASTVLGVAVVPIAYFFHVEGLWLATLAVVALITVYRLVELVRPSHRTSARAVAADVAAGAFVQLYITFMAGFYVVMTGVDGGQWWVLAGIIIVVSTDVGAYATGLSFGRHPMAPTISPKKTWEGFAGAAAAALLAGVLLGIFMLQQPWWIGVLLGAVLVLVATGGDLLESLIKRDLGIKDISTWLPGHGGFLDRLDSILPSAAVAFVAFRIFG
jgi:phosphatidate cytidylyltransferase